MRTDTREIPVIVGEPICSYCRVRLKAIPDDPVALPHGIYHPTCVGAVKRAWGRPSPRSV